MKSLRAEFATERDWQRAMAKADRYFLCKFVLGYDKLVYHYHGPSCWRAQDAHFPRKMFLEPRGYFKTTTKTITGIVQDILNHPDIAILLVTGVTDLGESILDVVKGHFQTNPAMLELFPEYCVPRGEWGNKTSFTMPNRTRTNQQEPTLMAAGVRTSLQGFHFDKIYADDLINEKNCNDRELVMASVRFVQGSFPLLRDRANGPYEIAGTRYDHADVHGYVLESDNVEKGGNFKCEVRAVIENDLPLIPELDDMAAIQKMRSAMKPEVFSAQMMQEPTSEHQKVSATDFRYHNATEDDLRAANLFLLTDAAYSKKEQNDYVALVVVAATPDGYWDVIEYTRDHLNPREFLNQVWHYWDKYKATSPLQGIGVQKAVLDLVLNFFLNEDMQKRKEYLPIHEVRIAGIDKVKRILRAVTQLRAHKLRFRIDMPELEDEFLKFPKAPHDDLTDALSDMAEVGFFPETVPPPPPPKEYQGNTFAEAQALLSREVWESMSETSTSVIPSQSRDLVGAAI